MKTIIASTMIPANSGKLHSYFIHFNVDEAGRARFVEEFGDQPVRPFQLLAMLGDVYDACGIKPAGVKDVSYREYAGRNCSHPALVVDGKYYRLNHQVGGDWLNNPAVASMAELVRQLSHGPRFEEDYLYEAVSREQRGGERLLRKDESPKWEIFIQEE